MNRCIFSISLFFVCFITNAQVTIDIRSDYNVNGQAIKKEILPSYYAEDGRITITFGIDKYGFPLQETIDESHTTVKDEKQRNSAKQSLSDSRFEMDLEQTDTLRGSVTYYFHKLSIEERDSLRTEFIAEIYNDTKVLASINKPYWKLYPTDNMWTFLELDTVKGMIWQVQYTVDKDGEKYRFKTPLSTSDKREETYSPKTSLPGRFELYKTQNMYNFILLDTFEGWTWQVQWSQDWEKRFTIPISTNY